MKRSYFVTYVFATNGETKIGNAGVHRSNQIKTLSDIEGIEKDIREKYGYEKLTLLNWRKFEHQTLLGKIKHFIKRRLTKPVNMA